MGQLAQEQLRLGRIGFLNVLPIYYPLESGIIAHELDIISGTPAYLNGLMSEGALDISVVSSIEYARHPERYFVLPDLSISCCGPVRSVLLLSRIPISELAGEKVLLSTQSHTSVALIKVLLSAHLGIEVQYRSANCTEALASGEAPVAFLAIGDEALRLRHHELYPYRWDLGEAWHAWTGLPFVFALWVVQRNAFERWNGYLEKVIRTLLSAKEWGLSNIDQICSHAAERGVLDTKELQDYYRCLNFDLSDEEQRGLDLFFRYLVQVGEIDKHPHLDICSPLAFVA